MAGPFETRETEIVEAIADTILARTSILTSTTVRGNVGSGVSVIPVQSAAGFAKNGYLHWFDNTGEAMMAISAVDPVANTLTLDFTGYASHGLPVNTQYAHADGAKVATNLMLHRPVAIAPMLRSGQNVVAVWPRTKKTHEFSVGSTISPIVVRIQVHLSLQQFDSDPIDPEVYNLLQQKANRTAMQQIENALNQNRHLMARYNAPGNHANGLGPQTGSNEFATSMWDTVVDVVDIPQAVGAMDVIVRPLRYNRQEPGS